MAGSYEGLLVGLSLIENLGDAAETIEELLWLVQRKIGAKKALKLLYKEFYPMCRGEKKPDRAFKEVQEIMNR